MQLTVRNLLHATEYMQLTARTWLHAAGGNHLIACN